MRKVSFARWWLVVLLCAASAWPAFSDLKDLDPLGNWAVAAGFAGGDYQAPVWVDLASLLVLVSPWDGERGQMAQVELTQISRLRRESLPQAPWLFPDDIETGGLYGQPPAQAGESTNGSK